MRKFICIFFMVMVGLFSLSLLGCGSDASQQSQSPPLTEADSGKTITLRQNDTIAVALQGSGSTGYIWEVASGAESHLTQVGSAEFIADSNATGSGGTYRFSFRATAQGTGTLKMIYHRPWETGVPPLHDFQITVVVTG